MIFQQQAATPGSIIEGRYCLTTNDANWTLSLRYENKIGLNLFANDINKTMNPTCLKFVSPVPFFVESTEPIEFVSFAVCWRSLTYSVHWLSFASFFVETIEFVLFERFVVETKSKICFRQQPAWVKIFYNNCFIIHVFTSKPILACKYANYEHVL